MNKIYISYSSNCIEIEHLTSRIYDYYIDTNIKILKKEFDKSSESTFSSSTVLIDGCDLFICFIDKRDSEIMFELGYALGKNKKIILIGDYRDIPYDLKNLTYIRQSEDINVILFNIERYLSLSEVKNEDFSNPNEHSIILERAVREPNYLDSIDPIQFEKLVYNLFCSNGLNVEMNTNYRDSGYDFMLYTPTGKRIMIEVKKYRTTSKVSISTIRQLVGSMVIEHIDAGVIITSGQYTNSVSHFINGIEQEVHLWTIDNLIDIHESIQKLM
ncbi:endonuclease [Clostridium aceticum]|uniref:Endonuclease n=1 Tax=Clostridium aceticum TaxID=84022 RepID=A0A0D8I687_9CLOT|nr:restriction endonuclease [Clostridium aceticum]AKL94712.1 endonuclease [Clostridium aceticum]KJF25564.1 hypothetical protein TZ02_18030 [Clostridium aceticum]